MLREGALNQAFVQRRSAQSFAEPAHVGADAGVAVGALQRAFVNVKRAVDLDLQGVDMLQRGGRSFAWCGRRRTACCARRDSPVGATSLRRAPSPKDGTRRRSDRRARRQARARRANCSASSGNRSAPRSRIALWFRRRDFAAARDRGGGRLDAPLGFAQRQLAAIDCLPVAADARDGAEAGLHARRIRCGECGGRSSNISGSSSAGSRLRST